MATSDVSTSSSRIPKKLQDSINSLLSTYPDGILVPNFGRLYNKVFWPEQFQYRKYGFSNIQEFAKAIPDVMSLQYSAKENDLKVCKSGTGKPLIEEDFGERLKPDRRGLFSLTYSKQMENPDSVYQDVVDRFAPAGKVIQVDASERKIFIRFKKKKEVLKALELFAADLGLKICVNQKTVSLEAEAKADPSLEETFTKGEKTVVIANLPAEVVKDDLNVYLRKYSPDSISIKQRNGNKVIFMYAYVRFNEEKHKNAQLMIEQLNGNYWKGKRLKCHEAKDKKTEKKKSEDNDTSKQVKDSSLSAEAGLPSTENGTNKVASSTLWWRK